MTYDGYGRLKTKHVPEQNVGTNTTYDYFADDTIQKVTDARGASVTYAQNGRHQITSKTYFAPSGITPTPNVSFAYDAAGNRTSMTDGFGSVSYNYNQLSRMSSETRNFTGLGNFTISYQYNLAGELNSITDPSNDTINYTHDSAGQVTGISGTPFGGVTSYASSIQYRAWGAVKHMNYGDSSTMNASFNSRLLVSAFSVSGKISKTYAYYADGRLRFSSDLLDHRFDRFYSFDHVSRLKQAFSGAEARGEPATTNRPYKQTFGYDAFSHLTARTNEIWWTAINSLSDTYVNNRRVQWQYDADGRYLTGGNATNTYDTAGHTVHIEVPSTHSSHSSVGFDGDGQQVKTEETTWNEEFQTDVTETNYYLRSSVLGGRVLTELSNGRSFVHFRSAIVAWQWGSSQWGSVDWDLKDPSKASVRRGSSGQELDPLGGDAGISPQTQIPDEGALIGYGSSYNAANAGSTYTVDGVRVSLDDFMRRVGGQYQETIAWVEAAALASVPKLHSYGVIDYTDQEGAHYIHIGGDEQKAMDEVSESNGTLVRNWLVPDAGSVSSLLSRLPQAPGPIPMQQVPLVNLKKLLQDTFKYKAKDLAQTCEQFISDLLRKAGELSEGKNNPVSLNMMTVYSMLHRQARGGFRLNDEGSNFIYTDWGPEPVSQPSGGGGSATGAWASQNRTIWISQLAIPAKTTTRNRAHIPFRYALYLIHELFHVAGSKGLYRHDIMNQSARAMGARDFDDAVRKYCIPQEMW